MFTYFNRKLRFVTWNLVRSMDSSCMNFIHKINIFKSFQQSLNSLSISKPCFIKQRTKHTDFLIKISDLDFFKIVKKRLKEVMGLNFKFKILEFKILVNS